MRKCNDGSRTSYTVHTPACHRNRSVRGPGLLPFWPPRSAALPAAQSCTACAHTVIPHYMQRPRSPNSSTRTSPSCAPLPCTATSQSAPQHFSCGPTQPGSGSGAEPEPEPWPAAARHGCDVPWRAPHRKSSGMRTWSVLWMMLCARRRQRGRAGRKEGSKEGGCSEDVWSQVAWVAAVRGGRSSR